MKTIPSKDRKEWRLLLTGDLNVPLKNFFFQMKVTQAKNQILSGKVELEEAVEEIYELCQKFRQAKYMEEDLDRIFGERQETPVSQTTPNKQVENRVKQIEKTEEKSVKSEENRAQNKEKIIQKIKKQEIEARNLRIKTEREELEKIKLELEKEREKARQLIAKQLEEERKNRLKIAEQKRLKAEQEKQKLQKVTKRKKVVKPKKKSFWGYIFGK